MMGKLREDISCMSAHLLLLNVRIMKKAEYPHARRNTPANEATTDARERFETWRPKGMARARRMIDWESPKRTVPNTLVRAIVARETGATKSLSRYPLDRSWNREEPALVARSMGIAESIPTARKLK